MSNCCWTSTTKAGSMPNLVMRREDLPLVPKPQFPIFLPLKSFERRDVLVLEAHLRRSRALEDLGDVDDVGAGLPGLARALGTTPVRNRRHRRPSTFWGTMSTPPSLIVRSMPAPCRSPGRSPRSTRQTGPASPTAVAA